MHVIKYSLLFGYLTTSAFFSTAQDRKPGLYEVTLVTTTVSPSRESPQPRTVQMCLTQAMIEKYGAIVPDNLSRVCKLANVVKNPGGMTAEIACSGPITGGGTLEVNWTDSEHSKGTIHFSGTMHPGDNDIKIEWNATTNSVYKGPDCGAVKPPAPPPGQ